MKRNTLPYRSYDFEAFRPFGGGASEFPEKEVQMDWFTSDLHLGHGMVVRERGFEDIESMHEKLYSMFDDVRKGDNLYLLGDIAWNKETAQQFFDYLIHKVKPAAIFVIEGNHDHNWLGKIARHPRIRYCQTMSIKGTKAGYHPVFLSHYPHIIYDKSHYGAFHLHGHGHETTADRPLLDNLVFGKRLNVNCELNNYRLWSRDDVEEYMRKMPENIDSILCKGYAQDKEKAIEAIKLAGKILRQALDGVRMPD